MKTPKKMNNGLSLKGIVATANANSTVRAIISRIESKISVAASCGEFSTSFNLGEGPNSRWFKRVSKQVISHFEDCGFEVMADGLDGKSLRFSWR